MKCDLTPTLPNPILGGGLTIAPTLPTPSFSGELCCKILTFDVAILPVPIPPLVISGVITGLHAAIEAVQTYIDQLPLRCPRE